MTPAWRARVAAFIWGVAEATLFFIVPDVLLSYIGVKHGPRAAAIASAFAALGAAVGGAIMVAWSADGPAALRAVLAVPAVSAQMVEAATAAMEANWFTATLLGPFTATPFKLYAVLAPWLGVSHLAFVLAAIPARLPRFLLVSVGAALLARLLAPRLGERGVLWLLLGAWALFYAVFFALMPN